MFIGHFAVGLAAKKATPKVSLGTLFLSVQLLDLLWPILALFGTTLSGTNAGSMRFASRHVPGVRDRVFRERPITY